MAFNMTGLHIFIFNTFPCIYSHLSGTPANGILPRLCWLMCVSDTKSVGKAWWICSGAHCICSAFFRSPILLRQHPCRALGNKAKSTWHCRAVWLYHTPPAQHPLMPSLSLMTVWVWDALRIVTHTLRHDMFYYSSFAFHLLQMETVFLVSFWLLNKTWQEIFCLHWASFTEVEFQLVTLPSLLWFS